MAQLVIGPLLRYVNADSATIWVETDVPCTVAVLGTATPTFTCAGHHYALVMLDDLPPASTLPYEVELDGERVWPPIDSGLPASVIRTPRSGARSVISFGSCRAARPHVPPYTLRLDDAPEGRGVDALRALGLGLLDRPPEEWPDLLLFGGDQVYADDQSPVAGERIRHHRTGAPGEPPEGVVADFEEYTWLYHEAWTPEIERWLLSTVPSAMIFDDHDMIDDWNISASWVRDIRSEPWWNDHVIGGLVSYWIHQHLGNLSPSAVRDEGLLAQCIAAGDATELLHRWALSSEEFTPVPGGYRFSFDRHIGPVHLVVIDARNGRVLEPGARQMVDDDEWAWVRDRAMEPTEHLVIAASLPIFVPGGLHGIQQWNEAMCDGRWGRLAASAGERLRRAVDLEGWPAFDRSFRAVEQLLIDIAAPRAAGVRPPSTVTVLGGDIHFSYAAPLELPEPSHSDVMQVVCSPLRNILRTRERRVMRFGSSRVGRRIGRWLAASAGRGPTALRWELAAEPVFDNAIATLVYDDDRCDVTIDSATLDDRGDEVLIERFRADGRRGRTDAAVQVAAIPWSAGATQPAGRSMT